MSLYECVVIGSGPSGIACSIELHKAGVNVLLVEKSAPGGKVNIAPRVDNYPGFTKIPGAELAFVLFNRVLEEKVPFRNEEVVSLTKENDLFKISFEKEDIFAKSVMIASGTKEKELGLKHEKEWLGKGISYCSVCDGHFFKGKDVVVIGGGNSALKETIHLSSIVNHVTLIHRRNQFRGNERIVDEIKVLANVTILTPYIPLAFLGEDKVSGILIKNVENNEEITLNCQGIFPLVGQLPNTSYIKIDGVIDEYGTIPIDQSCHTSVSGLFAGGDVTARPIRQIYVAELDGKKSAKAILEYLGK